MDAHLPSDPLKPRRARAAVGLAATLAREALEALLVAILFALFARSFVAQAFQIPTASMEPNVLVGDHLLVNKWIFSPAPALFLAQRPVRRGDVVVFRSPEDPRRDFVKRCLGLPGDRVEIVDKKLRVNGTAVDESGYALHSDPRTYPHSPFLPDELRLRDNFGPFLVPAESYFCLGDNRDNSRDSRFWGAVPAAAIKGRPLTVYWSAPPPPPGDDVASTLLEILTGTRTERWLRLVR